MISRHGAVIALNRKLAAQQELTIRCVGKRRETKARVVGMIAGQGDEFVYGIALLDPAMNLWDVEFPQLTGTEEPLARMLLKCSACGGREVVHLNEIEIQVFAANQRIERFCQSCSATTSWKQESKPAEGELDVPWAKQESGERSTVAPPTRARDKRKHNRVKTNVSACIRQIGFPDEVVVCEDLSRGGLCFRSRKRYLERSEINVAVPYSGGSGDIFVPARVVYVNEVGDRYRHGAAYVTAAEKSQGYDGSPCAVTSEH